MTAGAATPGRGGYGRAVDCCIVHQSAFSIAQRRNRRRMCQCQWDIVPVLLVPCPGSTSPFHDRTQCIGRALPWPGQLPSVHKHNTGLVAPVDLSGRGSGRQPRASFERRPVAAGPGRASTGIRGAGPRVQSPILHSRLVPACSGCSSCPGVHTGRDAHGGPFH